MKLEDIFQQCPDNESLREFAARLKSEALRVYVDCPRESDPIRQAATERAHRANCVRAAIVDFACDLKTQLAEFKNIGQQIDPVIASIVAEMMRLGEEQIAVELRSLQTYLDLLDAAEAVVVDSAATKAKAYAWLSCIERAVDTSHQTAHSVEGLRLNRLLIDDLLAQH